MIQDGTAGVELNTPMKWSRSGQYVKGAARLKTSLESPLHLVINIPVRPPHSPSLVLHDGSAGANNAFRLDVRGNHKNPDRTRWERATHLHVWTDQYRDRQAETPDGWPPDGLPPGMTAYSQEDVELIMNYFCRTCGVQLSSGYTWGTPFAHMPPSDEEHETNDFGDEIP